MMKTYCIRDDYQPNVVNVSNDAKSHQTYWTPERIHKSSIYQYAVYQYACQYAKTHKLKTVVDIGCGCAVKLNHFFDAAFDIYGVDQPFAMDYCQKTYDRGVYIAEDFDAPRFDLHKQLEHADMIICSDVIEHVEDPDLLLDYITKIARKDTVIVLSTPERDALRGEESLTPDNPAHLREWTQQEFTSYLQHQNFNIMETQLMFPFRFSFNKMTASYLWQQLKHGRPLNHCLMLVCKIKK